MRYHHNLMKVWLALVIVRFIIVVIRVVCYLVASEEPSALADDEKLCDKSNFVCFFLA